MIILGIETSCDETAAAVLQKDEGGIHILSNVVASSANLQAKYGGVIPEQAARQQLKSIIPAIEEALNQAFPDVILRPKAEESPVHTEPTFVGDPSLIAQDDRVKIIQDDRVNRIDAIAVTYGPGLIGSLLVGVETAKTLALVWNKPLVPVNHLIGHFYANWISPVHLRGVSFGFSQDKKAHLEGVVPSFPCLGLLVSGGHTDLVLFPKERSSASFKEHGKYILSSKDYNSRLRSNYEYLGGTRDDAAGECFDKCARLLGLPYPGGPQLAKLASQGDALRFDLPRPMINSKDFDFSFSGLKTAVANIIHTSEEPKLTSEVKHNIAASIEQAIVDVLVAKTIRAAQTFKVDQIMIAGGVAANQKLISDLKFKLFANANFASKNQSSKFKIKLHIPPPSLCTDNAAMIAGAAFFNYHPADPLTLQTDPNLSLS